VRDARGCSSSIPGRDAARTARDASRASFDRAERSDANDALDVFSARFRRARDDIAETAFVELRAVIFFILLIRVRPSIEVRRELVGCGARVFARIVSHSPQKRRGSAPSVGGAPRRLDARCVEQGRGLFMDKEVVKEHFDGRQGRQLRTSHQSSPANHGCRESSSLGRPLDAALSRTSVRFWRGRAFGERTSREFSANTLVAQPLSRARHRARRLMRVS